MPDSPPASNYSIDFVLDKHTGWTIKRADTHQSKKDGR